jgi:valyl-tRNA synthetase
VKGWEIDERLESPNTVAIQWFDSRFNEALAEIEDHYNQYRLSEALMSTYKLVWDDFCSWYLEMIKPAYQMPVDSTTYKETRSFFGKILTVVHPFMPFLTEELWHDELFGKRAEQDCCIVSKYPAAGKTDKKLLNDVIAIKDIISEVRNIRNIRILSPRIALPLAIKVNSKINYEAYLNIIFRLANISQVEFVNDQIPGASTFLAGTDEFFVSLEENVDPDAERERLSKEIEYLQGFLASVNTKLSNERFMQNAKKEIVDNELKKKSDAEEKLRILQESLDALE